MVARAWPRPVGGIRSRGDDHRAACLPPDIGPHLARGWRRGRRRDRARTREGRPTRSEGGPPAALGDRGPSARAVTLPIRTIGRSVAVLVGGTAIAQILGIARELFVASQIGLSRDLDALLIALTLPT